MKINKQIKKDKDMAKLITVNWFSEQVPLELQPLLRLLEKDYPIKENDSSEAGLQIAFRQSSQRHIAKVEIAGKQAMITYDRVIDAARALGALLAGHEGTEYGNFSRFGVMLDCSRNAVMKISYLKKWLRCLALMGYDTVMLYTEDTFVLPNEPQFGFLRGPYTLNEMQEIDRYARQLGIEMVACIQTLGHFEQVLQWDAYADIKDTDKTLLIDEAKSYKLIDKIFAFWSEAFKSRAIHIGMDEAHDLGRGKFMDRHGYEVGFELFNRHLKKVNDIAFKYDYSTPMIWSDMYFRMGNNNHSYYDSATNIPVAVKNKIPENVKLVYWDYYHEDNNFYTDWLHRHRELGRETVMCSGVWSWERLWYDHSKTVKTLIPCCDSCKAAGVEEFIIAAWGDDGAYCEFDSVLAGLCYGAELNYNSSVDNTRLSASFRAITGNNYAAYLLAGRIHTDAEISLVGGNLNFSISSGKLMSPVAMLWDDPLYAIVERSYGARATEVLEQSKLAWLKLRRELKAVKDDDSIQHIMIIINLLVAKIIYRQTLLEAYKHRDNEILILLAEALTADIIKKLYEFHASMRRQWMRRNKAFGFEVIQSRIYTAIGRYHEVAERIKELLNEDIKVIEELEVPFGSSYTIAIPSYNRCSFPTVNRW